MISRACKKLWIVKRLKSQGASISDLVDIYIKQVRSILEFGDPVQNSGLTSEEITDIERVQKSFLHIILQQNYQDYKSALEIAQLETLVYRRLNLCKTESGPNTRSDKNSYKLPICKLTRTMKGPIPYLTNLLNRKQK